MRALLIMILVTAICMFVINPVYASGNTGWVSLSRVHPWTDGLYILVFGNNDPSSCGGGNGGYMFLSPTHQQYKLISSVLLAALVADKKVLIYTGDECYNAGSQIIGAIIEK